MRVALKKQFLDRLSSVVCHHRVRDFIYFCIPNRRLDLVQAQMPAFLAEAHADAEAQAQVQGAQVQVQAAQAQAQVGEVSDVNRNVNNVNSPVVS